MSRYFSRTSGPGYLQNHEHRRRHKSFPVRRRNTSSWFYSENSRRRRSMHHRLCWYRSLYLYNILLHTDFRHIYLRICNMFRCLEPHIDNKN